MITLTREEAQQVLDALESCDQAEDLKGLMQWYDCKLIDAAVKIICLRLTEEQPKPLAYIHIKDDCIAGSHRKEGVFLPDGQYGLWPMETLSARLSAPEPKPHGYLWFTNYMEQRFTHRKPEERERIGDVKPVYTAPLQREWVGLRGEQIYEVAKEIVPKTLGFIDVPEWVIPFARAIEAKLKEKNDS